MYWSYPELAGICTGKKQALLVIKIKGSFCSSESQSLRDQEKEFMSQVPKDNVPHICTCTSFQLILLFFLTHWANPIKPLQ